jgi:2',3'-cyclic-nucleotide 2'-phosphodiesterase/3'-nucleotidase
MFHACLLALALATTRADTTHLVLVATTDVHGHATDWDFVADRPFPGGLVRAATVIDSLRARYPGEVLVVDAGDLIEGDPFASYYARTAPRVPHPLVEALNLIGYDVATPGNHDLDFGLTPFRDALASASFRYVSANLRELPADTLTLAPYAVVRRGSVRVAITGVTTPGTNVWSAAAMRGHLRVGRVVESAARVLPEARRNADVVVVLSHSGLAGRSSYDTSGVGGEDEAAALATLSPRPDLVVVGHSHREIADTVIGGVHFVQPPPLARGLSVVHLDLVPQAAGGWRIVRVRAQLVPLASVAPSATLAGHLARLRTEVADWLDQSLGESRGEMSAALARAEPTPIMNLIHAVERRRTGADLSAVSAFNLEARIPDGDVRRRDLFALYPYENTLRAIRITGAQLREYLEQSARYFTTDSLGRPGLDAGIPGYNYDMVGGASYEIDLRLPPGSRIRNLSVRGRAVQPNDTYTLALNNYRQSGGGGFTALAGAPVVYDRGESIRDLLAEEIRANGIDPAALADTNWRIVPAEAAAQVRRLFGAPTEARPAPAPPRVELRILALGPLAGALRPHATAPGGSRAAGGAAALATALRRASADCGCPTLRVATGGALAGSAEADLVAGRSAVEALNRLGVAAMAVGTDDFGWSLDTLRQRIAQSRFAWLAANVVDSATGRRPDWAQPFRILEAGRLRVATVGYLSPAAGPALRAAGVGGLEVGSGAPAIRTALAEAEAARPDLVVVLAHASAVCAEPGCRSEADALAAELQDSRVDLIIAGAGDAGTTHQVGRIWVVQPRAAGAEVGIVDVSGSAVGARELRVRREAVDAEGLPPDSEVAALVDRYAALADSIGRQPIARLRVPIARGLSGGGFGALLADAVRNAGRADVGAADGAALAADLPAGPVGYGALVAALPRPQPIVRASVRGAVLRALAEEIVAQDRPTLQLSGLTVRWARAERPGRRVKDLRLLDGRAVRGDAAYTLAVPGGVTGSGRWAALAGVRWEAAGARDRDALAAYLRRLPQPVTPPESSRFEETRR